MIRHGFSTAFTVRTQSRRYVRIVARMVGICILVYFTLATTRAQHLGVNPYQDRAKIIWHDDKPSLPSYFFPTRTDKNLDLPTTPRSTLSDDIPLWPSKDSSLNLQFPKFLFTDDEISKPNKIKMAVPAPTAALTDAQIQPLTETSDPNKFNSLVDNTEPKDDGKFKDPIKVDDQMGQQLMADLQEDASVQKQTNKEEELIREKIFSLAKETEKDLDAKVKIIEKTNSMYKHNNYYKLGFIVSYINTTHNALTDLVKHVERNRVDWDVLKILNAYVQIKKTKEFLAEMLSVLNILQSRQSLMMQPLAMEKKKLSLPLHQNIAWSYYDDA